MKKWKVVCMVLGIVTISSVSLGADVVAFDRTSRVMTRWDSGGNVVWTSTDVSHDAYQMEVGPDGYIYLGMWVDDRVAKIDPVTGSRVSEVALQQTPVTDRTWDLTFGNDFDGDGIDDLYTVSGTNKMVLGYGSASGYAGSSEQAWVIPDITRRTVSLDFGSDVSGDGIADLWVVDGDENNSGNFMHVLNGSTGATLYSWALTNLRGTKDVEVVGDRVYVVSANAHDIYSFALDGTDETRVVTGSDSPEYYMRQIQEGLDGLWYSANRFSGDWGGQQGGITQFDGDWTNGSAFYTAAGTDFSGVVTIVPEPATMLLLGLGSAVLLRRKK
jgi:hypothetical protein